MLADLCGDSVCLILNEMFISERVGAEVVECACLIELPDLQVS